MKNIYINSNVWYIPPNIGFAHYTNIPKIPNRYIIVAKDFNEARAICKSNKVNSFVKQVNEEELKKINFAFEQYGFDEKLPYPPIYTNCKLYILNDPTDTDLCDKAKRWFKVLQKEQQEYDKHIMKMAKASDLGKEK